MNFISFNGASLPADQPVLLPNNRGFRYGEGLFETIKVINGRIQLADFHFDRLFAGINLLEFKANTEFNANKLSFEILALCEKNDCTNLAKARLTVFNGDGELHVEREGLQYVIECMPLPPSVNHYNEVGLKIDIFPSGTKPLDQYANLKSSNFLIYALGAAYARKHGLDDCLLLNTSGTIADATIANLYIIKDEVIATPPLTDGCINGVLRRYLIENIQASGFKIMEKSITVEDLESADEVFLTNAIYGLRQVKQFRQKVFANNQSKNIYQRLIKTIWE